MTTSPLPDPTAPAAPAEHVTVTVDRLHDLAAAEAEALLGLGARLAGGAAPA